LIYVLFFVGVTAVWGWTFVVVKNAIAEYPTLPFLQLRFILAFLVMAVLVRRLPTRRELLVGLVVGSVLAVAYLTQTVGLSLISPGNAGLITGLLVLFTPLLDRVFGVPLRRRTIIAVIVAVIGIGMLTGGPSGFGLGDVLVIVCAVLFALHIVLLSRWSPGLRSAPLAMVQMGACALIFSAGGTWTLRMPSTDVWIAIVITGVFASALAFYIQTWAQAHIDASRTALIIAMEPAWAVAAAVVLAGQRFGLLQAAGAALVMAAIVGHELAPVKFKTPEHEPIET
jgi:drug/metabolite transporter (DMT)-like permease